MHRMLIAAFVVALAAGCGPEEKKVEEPSQLPDADKHFDKSKLIDPKPNPVKNDKGQAG